MVSTMVRWFTIFESDAIVYICTYYHSTNRTQNIYYRHCSELLLPRCINLLIGGAKHSLIPVVCVLSDIYYCNLASISDASRPGLTPSIWRQLYNCMYKDHAKRAFAGKVRHFVVLLLDWRKISVIVFPLYTSLCSVGCRHMRLPQQPITNRYTNFSLLIIYIWVEICAKVYKIFKPQYNCAIAIYLYIKIRFNA